MSVEHISGIRRYETIGYNLGKTQACHDFPCFVTECDFGGLTLVGRSDTGISDGDLIKADQPCHFFHQINFPRNIHSKGWRLDPKNIVIRIMHLHFKGAQIPAYLTL